jgi:hypothetical protein
MALFNILHSTTGWQGKNDVNLLIVIVAISERQAEKQQHILTCVLPVLKQKSHRSFQVHCKFPMNSTFHQFMGHTYTLSSVSKPSNVVN